MTYNPYMTDQTLAWCFLVQLGERAKLEHKSKPVRFVKEYLMRRGFPKREVFHEFLWETRPIENGIWFFE